jgi:hypothetical protein
MKALLFIVMAGLTTNGYAQTTNQVSGTTNQRKNFQNNTTPQSKTVNQGNSNTTQGTQAFQTATDRYLNGPTRKNSGTNNSTNSTNNSQGNNGANSVNTSPFVGGVHAANSAGKTFDTLNATNSTAGNTGTTRIAGGKDTTFNANTINNGGITTNLGAVDRSGQAQFGQTNWGSSRSTVGESQWTVPPPITASFNKEFPAANGATWSRNNVDTSLFSARYKSGTTWVTTNYNATGQRLDMRTEYPLPQPPRAVSVYLAKQPAGFEIISIYKIEMQGRPDIYEVQSKNGKTIYINNDGMEVNN